MELETSRRPFDGHPAWQELAGRRPAERFAQLQQDATLRARLVDGTPSAAMLAMLSRTFPIGAMLDYEPDPSTSITSQAAPQGGNPLQLSLDLMLAEDGKGLLLNTFENYNAGNLDVVREMLLDDATVMGVADGGAHVGVICDASAPTFLLSHWARDRKRGPGLPLEFLVKKHTADTAAAYGLGDRGVLAPGMRADIAVIDFDRLALTRPEVIYDLPAGGRRLMQRARGYRHVFVSGVETLQGDAHTGNLPGRLVRGARPRP
jgi:N-acyl-D-amino-acid deacylase